MPAALTRRPRRSPARAAVFLAILLAAPCAAQDAPGRAAQKAQPCAVCHGQDGIGTSPIFPNLAGQKALYLVKVLKEYRSGRRADPERVAAHFRRLVAERVARQAAGAAT